MRRPFVIKAGPTTNLGGLGDTFAQMYNAVPGPQERQTQQAQLAAQQAQTDLYGAKADKARQEVNQARQLQAGRGGMADVFASMAGPSDYEPSQEQLAGSGQTFAATYGMPTEENTTNYAAAQDQFAQDEMQRAASEAFEIATRSGVDAQEASRIIRTGLAKNGASPEYIQRLGFAVNPSYAVGTNEAVSVDDRMGMNARSRLQETSLNRMDNRTTLQQTGMRTASDERIAAADRYADPITAGPDEKVLPNPNDPRTKGYEGPELRVGDRVAAGEKVNDQQAAMVGADGSAGKSKQRVQLQGPNGETQSGYFDPGSGTYHFMDGSRVGEGWTAYNQPQPQGTNEDLGLNSNVQGNLQEGAIAFKDFQTTMGMLKGIAENDPSIFGTTGNVRRLGQGAVGQMRALFPTQFEDAQQQLVEAGVAPGYFDRDLSDIDKIANLAAYQAASALAQQTGRGLSDKDFQRFRNIIGDPTSWLSTQEQFMSGLNRVQTLANSMRENRMEALYGPDWREQVGEGEQPQVAPAPTGEQPAAGGGQPKRMRYNPDTGELEPVQ